MRVNLSEEQIRYIFTKIETDVVAGNPLADAVERELDYCLMDEEEQANYTPGSWKHMDWCPSLAGHPGDCWAENNRALGIEPGPAITVVELDDHNQPIRKVEIR